MVLSIKVHSSLTKTFVSVILKSNDPPFLKVDRFPVTPGGFEPSTNCLRGNCSAVELRSQLDANLMRTEIIPEGEYMSISVGTYLFAGEHGIDEK